MVRLPVLSLVEHLSSAVRLCVPPWPHSSGRETGPGRESSLVSRTCRPTREEWVQGPEALQPCSGCLAWPRDWPLGRKGELPMRSNKWLHSTPSCNQKSVPRRHVLSGSRALSPGRGGRRGRLVAKPPGLRSPRPGRAPGPQDGASNQGWAPGLGHLPFQLSRTIPPRTFLPGRERVFFLVFLVLFFGHATRPAGS